MRARGTLLAAAAVVLVSLTAWAAGPAGHVDLVNGEDRPTIGSTVWFQGYLADSVTGDPLTGTYDVAAAIFTLESGGAPVWGPEAHTATQVLEGWFHIELGSIVTPFLTFSLPPYYLELTVNGETLSPRQKLASVPAAIRSGDDGDWTMSGGNLYRETGTVYVGIPVPPGAALTDGDRAAPGSRDALVLYSSAENGIGAYGVVTETDNSEDWRNGVVGFRNRSVSAPGTGYGVGETSNGVAGYNLWGDAYTFGVAGYCYNDANRTGGVLGAEYDGSPWGALGYKDDASAKWGVYTPDDAHVGGNLVIAGFEMPTGASAGHVLTSDAAGVGTWQAAPGGVGGGGTAGYLPKFAAATTLGNSALYESSGRIGLGTTTPAAGLSVVRPGADRSGLEVLSSVYSSEPLVLIEKTDGSMMGEELLSIRAPSYARTGSAFISCELAEGEKFRVEGSGEVRCSRLSIGDGYVSATIDDDDAAGNFSSTRESGTGRAIRAGFEPTGPYDGVAIEGTATPADFYGVGGRFTGGWYGVEGIVSPTGSNWYIGVRGAANGGAGQNYGLYGVASGLGTNYGVYGLASGSTTNYAGYFEGDVHVTGTLSGGKAGMKIDHPLDPANQYLSHSFVGSSEMLNVYSGNVMLDAAGEAVVELPDWFEALNGDFRYQLTAVGAPAPNLHVAEKVRGGRFAIAGGAPGMEVSWQITATRRDPVASREPMAVESAKPATEVGRYVNPEPYGRPASEAVGYEGEKAMYR